MKKAIYLCLSLLVLSCSATKTAGGDQATPKMSKKLLKGTWTVSDIRFVGEAGLYKADLFGVADSPCFKGGEWLFIPNNGTGRFTINGNERCTEGTSRILWSFNNQQDGTGEILFKYVDEKNKPLAGNTTGYSISVQSLTEANAELRVKTEYDGQAFDVVMTLDKTSNEVRL